MTTIKIRDAEIPFKLEWGRSFLGVLDAGGFTRAARRLGMSQAAVSTHVKELEVNLGVRLLERVAGRTRLTPPGEGVAREIRRMLEGVRAIRDAVTESEGAVRGLLSVAASTTPGNYLLPQRLREFERRHPEARTALVVDNSARVLDRLATGEADLAFTGVEGPGDRFVSRPFAEDLVAPFVAPSHPLARRRAVGPTDLDGERLLLREEDSATRRLVERWLAGRKARPEVLEPGSPETVKRAAAAGLGVGILSRFALDWELAEKRLVLLRMPGFPLRRRLWIVQRRGGHLSRLMRAFLDGLRSVP
jgi:DNA-binding transcriptional LysR family regulator